jgi:exoribonuclease R
MAQLSSQASVQFNTYLYFKSLSQTKEDDCRQTAIIMRITQGGIYVMVQKYGLEGLLVTQGSLQCRPEQETAVINGKEVKVFDRVKVMIKAEMVEFRRSVSLLY